MIIFVQQVFSKINIRYLNLLCFFHLTQLLLSNSGIIFVCCDPDSWASDLAKFLKNRWKLESASVFDFFPQTPNVESAAVLILDSEVI